MSWSYVVVWTRCAGDFDCRHVGALPWHLNWPSTLRSVRLRQRRQPHSLGSSSSVPIMPFYQMLCITAHYNEYVSQRIQ